MSKTNLEVAKECGFDEIEVCDSNFESPEPTYFVYSGTSDQLDAYTSRICAEKDAEIGRWRAIAVNRQDMVDEAKSIMSEVKSELSEANTRIAMQTEALQMMFDSFGDCVEGGDADEVIQFAKEALSASAESVATWEAEKLEPLRRGVATLRNTAAKYRGMQNRRPFPDLELLCQYAEDLDSAINDAQATAEAYDREHAAKVQEVMDELLDANYKLESALHENAELTRKLTEQQAVICNLSPAVNETRKGCEELTKLIEESRKQEREECAKQKKEKPND